MAKEIERKFRVLTTDYKKQATYSLYRQGYLSTDPDRCVRVRTVDTRGYLTIKGRTHHCERDEYEYEIPHAQAQELLENLCLKPLVEKRRYRLPQGDLVWEIDEFLGANQGLVIAEIELPCIDYSFTLPAWIGEEVTGDARYYNANLIANPYKNWK